LGGGGLRWGVTGGGGVWVGGWSEVSVGVEGGLGRGWLGGLGAVGEAGVWGRWVVVMVWAAGEGVVRCLWAL
jgi:hypothetical protein